MEGAESVTAAGSELGMTGSQEPEFSGEIRVASRIIDYLSSGLYETPAACLKELVNNSYDADASVVKLFVKPEADRIIVEDDGLGMSKEEFTKHFDRISESHKRDDGDVTAAGRPIIGRIGIGFIAANEICNVMEILSTKAGSTDLLHVKVNFAEMRKDLNARRREGDDIAKGDYEGWIEPAQKDEHFTLLILKDVKGEARDILASVQARQTSSTPWSIYGLCKGRSNPVAVAGRKREHLGSDAIGFGALLPWLLEGPR